MESASTPVYQLEPRPIYDRSPYLSAMRKRDLEISLQSVRNFEDPDPSLEQYMTPGVIAADILYTAYANGDIEGMKVMDLGCGTGMFSIGAWLLVMMAELINTAVEEALNLITRDYNVAVKNAKDMASAAVFLMLALNAALWLCTFVLNLF